MERVMRNCFYNEDKKLQCSDCGSTDMSFYACCDGADRFGYKYQCGNGHIVSLEFIYDKPEVKNYKFNNDGTCIITDKNGNVEIRREKAGNVDE